MVAEWIGRDCVWPAVCADASSNFCDRWKLWRGGGDSGFSGFAGEQSRRELSGYRLDDSGSLGGGGNLQQELFCVHSRGVRQRISSFRCELGEVAEREFLQSVAAESRGRRSEGDNLPRDGRSACAV